METDTKNLRILLKRGKAWLWIPVFLLMFGRDLLRSFSYSPGLFYSSLTINLSFACFLLFFVFYLGRFVFRLFFEFSPEGLTSSGPPQWREQRLFVSWQRLAEQDIDIGKPNWFYPLFVIYKKNRFGERKFLSQFPPPLNWIENQDEVVTVLDKIPPNKLTEAILPDIKK